MAKIRVYELARELGKENKALENTIRGLGISIKNYMSTLTPEQADVVRRELGAKPVAAAAPRSAAPVRAAVRRRRATGPRPAEKEAALEAEAEAEANAVAGSPTAAPPVAAPVAAPVVARRSAVVRRPAIDHVGASPAPSSAPAPSNGLHVAPVNSESSAPAGTRTSAVPTPVAPPIAPRATRPEADYDQIEAEPRSIRSSAPTADGPSGSGVAPAPAAERVARRAPPVEVSEPPRRVPPSSATASSSPRPETFSSSASTQREAAPAGAPPSPAVGSRIELPRGTRRLPGGMAERMRDQPAGGVDEAPSRRTGSQARIETAGTRGEAAVAPVVAEARSSVVVSRTADRSDADGRRVLRNEDGVIVGTTPERSEPRILGFIPLEQRRARPQVIITEVGKNDSKGRATRRKQREERAQQQGRRRKTPVRKSGGRGDRPSSPRPASEMSEAKRRVRVDEAIQVSDLAHAMGQKAAKIIRVLWGMGMRGITINHAIDVETAELVAAEFGYTIENVAFQEEDIVGAEEESEGELRAPVVTIMGHVDHGKTSLLDHIREANVASGEAGGITQHVGAYRVDTPKGSVVFLDTPGHQAFSAMRARGAQATDIVVLVVAADDGVMPTTVEAIGHAKESNVPIVVAINKVDKPEANVGRVKQMLMEHGLVGEEFGGETIICEVSAKTGQGIEALLENLALQAEVLDLRAPDDGRASGVVLEARVDKGRGPVASVLVQSGLLRRGDIVVANEFYGKIRGLVSDAGEPLEEASPSTPVEVLGLDGVPAAGDRFHVVESERDAKQLVTHRRDSRRRKESVKKGPSVFERIQKKKTPILNIVLRTDVQGSAEAMKETLEAMSVEKVRVEVIFAGVGAITENDVKRAKPADAVILGFNVKPAGKAGQLAESENVPIHLHSVIYEATDKVKELMIDLLEPEYREREQGEAEVRQIFAIPRLGVICGCRVTRGSVFRNSHVRVRRGDEIVYTGHIASLRRFKDDVRDVKEGAECGIAVEGFTDAQPGDVIEAYELETLRPEL